MFNIRNVSQCQEKKERIVPQFFFIDRATKCVVKESVSKKLVIGIITAIVVIFLGCCISYKGYITDDTFITLQFAKNLKTGFGLSFNPGQPSYGFTSPLWIFILTIFPYPIFAKIMGILLGALSILVFYLLSKKILGDEFISIVATLIFAYDPLFIRWSSSGMEAALAILLMLIGMLLFQKRNTYFAVFMGLATLARPEIGMLSIILLFFLNRREAVKSFLIFLAIVLPYLIFSYLYFGSILPNTFLSKHGFVYFPRFIYSVSTGGKILIGTYFLEGIFFIALCIKKWQKRFLIPILWCFLLFFFYAIGGMRIQSRYLLLLTPFIIIWGFKGMYSFLKSRVVIPAVLLIVLNSYFVWAVNRPACIKFAKGTRECFIPVAKWIKANTEKDAVIGVGDIGAIGYYSEREILDLGGLVTKDMIPLLRRNELQEIIDKSLYESVKKIDYLVYRAREPATLKGKYNPLYSEFHPALGLSDPVGWFYTIYKVEQTDIETVE